ncbi:MAG: hypothetical protein FJZ49_06735 [Candidatus Verstraetearchaeota archaeon]|nr:hypothetical protein [Candidatus Verstraetearchaeota archaeon]
MNGKRGFVFILMALILSLIMVSTCFLATSLASPINVVFTTDPGASRQIYRSILIGAGVAASQSNEPVGSSESYVTSSMNALALIPHLTFFIPAYNGTGLGEQRPPSSNDTSYGVIFRSYEAGNGSVIRVENVPINSTMILTDKKHNILATSVSTSPSVEIDIGYALLPSAYLLIYTPDSLVWTYSGTVSPSYCFNVSPSDYAISAVSWAPPAGFSSIIVYGAPQLALVQVTDSGGSPVRSSVKDLHYQYAVVGASGLPMPMTGRVTVRTVTAWYYGEVKGGDVYAFA